jgi:hypothetical protein
MLIGYAKLLQMPYRSITCSGAESRVTGSVGTVATYEAEATDDVEVASFSCDPPSRSVAPSTTGGHLYCFRSSDSNTVTPPL